MKTLTRQLRDRILQIVNDEHEPVVYLGPDSFVVSDRQIHVHTDGQVWLWHLQMLAPLTWDDRRSIGRAARRRHAKLQAELIRLGQRAARGATA